MNNIHQQVRKKYNEHRKEILLGYLLISIFEILDSVMPTKSGTQSHIGLNVIMIILAIIVTMLAGAFILETLNLVRHNEFTVKGMFNHFQENWGRLFTVNLFLGLVGMGSFFLATLIGGLFIPKNDYQSLLFAASIVAVIAVLIMVILYAYFYCFAFYYIDDEPFNGPITNLKLSRKDLKTHRMELFKLDLTYLIVWAPFILLNILAMVMRNETFITISKVLSFLASFWVFPKLIIVRSLFYDRIVYGRVHE